MTIKLILYFVFFPLTIWSLESINLEKLFKKDHVLQIQILYFILSMALAYLEVNFCYDVFLNSNLL